MAAEIQEAPIRGNDNVGAAKGNTDTVRQEGNSPEAKGIIQSMQGNSDTSGYLNPGFGIEEPSKAPAPELDANAAGQGNPTEAPAGKDTGSAHSNAGDSQGNGNGNDQPAQGGPVEAPAGKDSSSSQGNPDDPSVVKGEVIAQPAQSNGGDGQTNGNGNGNDQSAPANAGAGEWERSATDPSAPPVWQPFERDARDTGNGDPLDPAVIQGGGNDQPAQGNAGDGQNNGKANDQAANPGDVQTNGNGNDQAPPANAGAGEWERSATDPSAPPVWQPFERDARDTGNGEPLDPAVIQGGGNDQTAQANPGDVQTNGKANDQTNDQTNGNANDQTNSNANDQTAQANPGDVQTNGKANDQTNANANDQTNGNANDQTNGNANDQSGQGNTAASQFEWNWDALNPQAPPVAYTFEPDASNSGGYTIPPA